MLPISENRRFSSTLSEKLDTPIRPEVVGRYAPSPSGRMHLGNIFSFLVSYLYIKQQHGHMVLRIEDLDPSRSKQTYIDQILRDLEWFAFDWVGDIVYQSERSEAYREAFKSLDARELVYPCFCSRADLHSAQAPHWGEEYLYQGTCKALSQEEIKEKSSLSPAAFRLIVPDKTVELNDLFQGTFQQNLMYECGDFVVRRKDGTFAYQLAVVLDDYYQGVTTVIRGIDLLSSSPRQRYLQSLLNLPFVTYGHVPIISDEKGRRLSKRNNDISLDVLQDQGYSAHEILGILSYKTGIIPKAEALSLDELVQVADLSRLTNKKVFVLS